MKTSKKVWLDRPGRPVHYLHYSHGQYSHTYCGLVNFTGYQSWNFTRTRGEVTCKRCLGQLHKTSKVISFKARLKHYKKTG